MLRELKKEKKEKNLFFNKPFKQEYKKRHDFIFTIKSLLKIFNKKTIFQQQQKNWLL